MDILKIANLLDLSGSYVLSDKLYKIAATYYPPVEFYSGVDKSKYDLTKGRKSYDQMMSARNKNMPENLSGTVVMDGSMYYNNPYTPKDVLKLRNQILPTNFRGELKRFYSGDNELSSSNPRSFATSLWQFARKNKLNYSLTDAFDAYANSGATYKGQSIKNVPELRELYLHIKSNAKKFSETEVGDILEDLFAGK